MKRYLIALVVAIVLLVGWVVFQLFFNFGTLNVAIDPAGAVVEVNEEFYDVDTARSLKLKPGHHTILVYKASFATAVETVEVGLFSTTELNLELRQLSTEDVVALAAGEQLAAGSLDRIDSDRYFAGGDWFVGVAVPAPGANINSSIVVMEKVGQTWELVILGTGNFEDYRSRLPPDVYTYLNSL